VAGTCDVDNNNHGYLLEFHDHYGHPQQWAMPHELLEEQCEYRKVLRRLGLRISSAARPHLQTYLENCSVKERVRCVDRVGWYSAAYVLPDTTLGEVGEERLVLQTLDRNSEGYRQAGTLEGWGTEIASRCVGNSRLLVAASTGFAAPLLEPLGEESGGLHFRGESSEGKTTALLIAATVWGEPGRLERWRATANSLEGVALAHNDNLLCLDELKELDPREAGGVAYMLANGAGKRRGQAYGGTRPRLTWRLLFLSTGETSLEQHIAEVGQRIQAGQEVRLVDVPADAGVGLGLFEDLHGAHRVVKHLRISSRTRPTTTMDTLAAPSWRL
jgi:putative DNA primase/helicase